MHKYQGAKNFGHITLTRLPAEIEGETNKETTAFSKKETTPLASLLFKKMQGKKDIHGYV